MKKMNKKGFTIVELVIVIAVIAILSAVMIPTFSGIVDKANQSALEQKVAAAYKEAMAEELADDGLYNGSKYNAKVDGTAAIGTEAKAYKVDTNILIVWSGTEGDATVKFITEEKDFEGALITDGKVELKETVTLS